MAMCINIQKTKAKAKEETKEDLEELRGDLTLCWAMGATALEFHTGEI